MARRALLVILVILISVGSTSAYAINITLGGTVDITQILNMMNNKITNVGTPTVSTDAATNGYVDSVALTGTPGTIDADTLDGIDSTGFLTTGTDTLEDLNCTSSELARWNGVAWECVTLSVHSQLVTLVDNTFNVGKHSSIAIGVDNLPVISYYDGTNGVLKVLHCGNTYCSSGNTITTVDNTNDVGEYTSIAIGSDNLPVISYYDATFNALKVLHCGDADCAESVNDNTIVFAHLSGDVGEYSSIAIGDDGYPVISYYDDGTDDLWVGHCATITCSTLDFVTRVDSAGDVGKYSSILVLFGEPVISYFDGPPNNDLKVVHCGDPDCAENETSNTITTVDSAGTVGAHSSIVQSHNRAIISYFDGTNGLKVMYCGDRDCAENEISNTITTVDSFFDAGRYSSITIGTDDLPVISYLVQEIGELKVLYCGNLMCTSENASITVDNDNGFSAGEYSSIAIGSDDNPIISYYNGGNGNGLKVAVVGTVITLE